MTTHLGGSGRRRLVPVALAATFGLSLVGPLGVARGYLTTSQVAAGSTISAGTVFPGARTTSDWGLLDVSAGGTGVNASDAISFAADGRTRTTGAWTTTFVPATRYLEIPFVPSLPAAVPVSGATFLLDVAAVGGSNTCLYFDVRRISTGAVLATHGAPASPILCTTSATAQATSTALPEVTTTDVANDLKVRIYASSNLSRGMVVDRATVTLTLASTALTLYEASFTDASTGTATTTAWSLAASDGTTYSTVSAWPTAWNAASYLQFTFPAIVPSGATVTAATLTHVWKDASAADTICAYLQVYGGATLIGTHGSSVAPLSCNVNGAALTTDTVVLPEVTTAAIADGLVVRFVGQSSTGRKSLHDRLQLSVTYRLP